MSNGKQEAPGWEIRIRPVARSLIGLAIATLLALAARSYIGGGILCTVLGTGAAEEKLAALRAFFDGWGVAAPLALFVFVVLEVVISPLRGALRVFCWDWLLFVRRVVT